MATQKEIIDAIARNLSSFRIRKEMKQAQVAEVIGVSPDAVRKAESGQNLASYIKIAKWARALGTTPNHILDFQEGEREAFLGAIEGAFISRGMEVAQAEALAQIVIEVLDSPEVRTGGKSIRDNARIAAMILTRKLFAK
jgi:transcriptional regulator with XRE-family HTH domain